MYMPNQALQNRLAQNPALQQRFAQNPALQSRLGQLPEAQRQAMIVQNYPWMSQVAGQPGAMRQDPAGILQGLVARGAPVNPIYAPGATTPLSAAPVNPILRGPGGVNPNQGFLGGTQGASISGVPANMPYSAGGQGVVAGIPGNYGPQYGNPYAEAGRIAASPLGAVNQPAALGYGGSGYQAPVNQMALQQQALRQAPVNQMALQQSGLQQQNPMALQQQALRQAPVNQMAVSPASPVGQAPWQPVSGYSVNAPAAQGYSSYGSVGGYSGAPAVTGSRNGFVAPGWI
jgi:hypothetical protein